jgi:hypothetical protein
MSSIGSTTPRVSPVAAFTQLRQNVTQMIAAARSGVSLATFTPQATAMQDRYAAINSALASRRLDDRQVSVVERDRGVVGRTLDKNLILKGFVERLVSVGKSAPEILATVAPPPPAKTLDASDFAGPTS